MTAYSSSLPWRSGVAKNGDVSLHYDEVGPPDGAPLILIMGLSIQSIFWPDELCQDLVDRGFRVVRFDNRDIGLSSAVDRGVPVNITRDFLLSRAGVLPRANYTLHDMVDDTAAVMDAVGFGGAHLCGLSMGGIIAQMLAVRSPRRVRSLTLIMSHTNHPVWGTPHPAVLMRMGPPPPGASAEEIIERNVQSFQLLGSPAYRRSDDELRHAFTVAYHRDPRTAGLDRQTHALFATGCIDKILSRITQPTSVLHGLADRLVVPKNAHRVAARIAGARLALYPGMGHDFPLALLPDWAKHVAETAARAP